MAEFKLLTVFAGSNNISQYEGDGYVFESNVTNIRIHPEYNSRTKVNDIAVLTVRIRISERTYRYKNVSLSISCNFSLNDHFRVTIQKLHQLIFEEHLLSKTLTVKCLVGDSQVR